MAVWYQPFDAKPFSERTNLRGFAKLSKEIAVSVISGSQADCAAANPSRKSNVPALARRLE